MALTTQYNSGIFQKGTIEDLLKLMYGGKAVILFDENPRFQNSMGTSRKDVKPVFEQAIEPIYYWDRK